MRASPLREPPTHGRRSAALGVLPPPPSSASRLGGIPPLRPFPVSSGVVASRVSRRSHLLSVPPVLHLVLWSPRWAQRPLERDRAAVTNGSCCPVAGGHACTNVPAPGQASAGRACASQPPSASVSADRPCHICLRRVCPASPPWCFRHWGPAVCQQPQERRSSLLWTATGWGPRRSLDEPSGAPRITPLPAAPPCH